MRDATRVEFEWVFRGSDAGRVPAAVRAPARSRRHRPSGGVGAAGGSPAGDQAGEAEPGTAGGHPGRRHQYRRSAPDVDLARAVAALPAQQRAAVALFYVEDRPVDEVAQLLGVSSSTAKQHLHRARTRLAELLAETKEEVPGDVN